MCDATTLDGVGGDLALQPGTVFVQLKADDKAVRAIPAPHAAEFVVIIAFDYKERDARIYFYRSGGTTCVVTPRFNLESNTRGFVAALCEILSWENPKTRDFMFSTLLATIPPYHASERLRRLVLWSGIQSLLHLSRFFKLHCFLRCGFARMESKTKRSEITLKNPKTQNFKSILEYISIRSEHL